MKTKPLIILILFLLWGTGSTYWYVCRIKGFCPPEQTQVKQATPQPQDSGTSEQTLEKVPEPVVNKPFLSFNTGDAVPHINNDSLWKTNINAILGQAPKGMRLQIAGPYYAKETNNTSYKTLGLARAEQLKALLAALTDTSKVITTDRLIAADSIPAFFNGFDDTFKWITYNDFVHEEGQKTLIYFPFNSDREIRNPEINRYLDNLAEKLKAHPDTRIKITGHTDNIGKAEINLWTGMQRAKRIRNVLVSKGVDASRISIASEGEKKPIASNATKEGRRKNRRVEIEIIQ